MGFNPFEEIGKAAAGAGAFLQEQGANVAHAVSDGAEQAAKAVGDGIGQATKAANDVGVFVQEQGGNAARAIGDGAGQIAKAADGGLKQAAQFAEEAGNAFQENAENAAKAISAGAGAAGGAVKDAGEKAMLVLWEDVAPAVQKGASAVAVAAGNAVSDAKRALFGPISREALTSDWFSIPKMIEIVDVAKKRPVDVEFSAVGWQSTEAGIRVLHIYDDSIGLLPLKFQPNAFAGGLYYADPLNDARFINLNNYADVIASERKAELLNIAACLGAKHCRLECKEEKKRVVSGSAKRNVKIQARVDGLLAETGQEDSINAKAQHFSDSVTLFEQDYEGNDNPRVPELHWYAKEPKILQLIAARCNGENAIKRYAETISSKKALTFDLGLAEKIDGALEKMKVTANFSFKAQAQEEIRQTHVFIVEF